MYSEDDILPVASILITNILRPVEQPNIFRKYAQKRFYRVRINVFAFMTFILNPVSVQHPSSGMGIGSMDFRKFGRPSPPPGQSQSRGEGHAIDRRGAAVEVILRIGTKPWWLALCSNNIYFKYPYSVLLNLCRCLMKGRP